jgi:hypothetical protein
MKTPLPKKLIPVMSWAQAEVEALDASVERAFEEWMHLVVEAGKDDADVVARLNAAVEAITVRIKAYEGLDRV